MIQIDEVGPVNLNLYGVIGAGIKKDLTYKYKHMKKDLTFKIKDLFTVEQIDYSDGVIRYNIKGKDQDGTSFSCGVYSEMETIIEMLVLMGKISRPTVYVSK